jgi:aryl-alcohol dehydrogenase-like predicted oxidoreductase
MKLRQLGLTDVHVSPVGLGGIVLGPEPGARPDVGHAKAVIAASVEAGVNWIDTSENYYDTGNESVIGAALTGLSRECLVATKVAPAALITGGASGFRPEQVAAACRSSLGRLGRDRIDIFLLHWPDESGVPLEDTWGAMAELVDQGLVRAIGLSNFEIADVERCHAQRPVDVVEDGLSLIDYLDHRRLFARCAELGIGSAIYEPLASGILTGKTRDQVLDTWQGEWHEAPFFKRLLGPGRADHAFRVAEGLQPIAERVGATVAQVAIAWVLHQPGVTAALAGTGSLGHVAQNAGAADLDLEGVLDEIEKLIPLGPAFGPPL